MSAAEEWRSVPGNTWIEASSIGRIRASYQSPMPNGGFRDRTVSPTFGYDSSATKAAKTVRKITRMRGRTWKIHQLVCAAFHGVAPSEHHVVLHEDDDGRNNNVSNLSWGTQKQNLNAPGFISYCRARTGANNPYIKGKNLYPTGQELDFDRSRE